RSWPRLPAACMYAGCYLQLVHWSIRSGLKERQRHASRAERREPTARTVARREGEMQAVGLAGVEDVRGERPPDPGIQEAQGGLVRVRQSAICGADLLPFRGLTPGFEHGTVLGHEFVGIIVEVGAEVRRVKPGQRVVCTSTLSDGTCLHCRAGRVSQC